MSAIKPIKRSKQLAPLSREHHDTLLFSWKVKQGLTNGAATSEISEYVRWYWNNFLLPHFNEEERILLAYLPESDELGKRMKEEHSNITELYTGPLGRSALTIAAEVIKDHIHFEERQLYPHIEEKLSKDQLKAVFFQLEQQPHCQEKWQNEFWEKKK